MTKREMFEAIVAGKVDAEVVAMAQAELEKMDVANARKSSKAAQAKAETDAPLIEKIELLLEGKVLVASTVGAALGISTQKAQALLKKMAAEGTVVVSDVKIEKVGMRKAYALA